MGTAHYGPFIIASNIPKSVGRIDPTTRARATNLPQPIYIVREATRVEYEASCVDRGIPPMDGRYYYEIHTD